MAYTPRKSGRFVRETPDGLPRPATEEERSIARGTVVAAPEPEPEPEPEPKDNPGKAASKSRGKEA